MRVSQLLVPAGLIGGLLVASAAAGRSVARGDASSDAKATAFQWDDLADALDDAAVGRRTRPAEADRAGAAVDVRRSVAELDALARRLQRMRRELEARNLEGWLEEAGVDVDELDIDLDDLADHLEDLEEAAADLADYAAALDARLEIRVAGERVFVVERRGTHR